MNFDPLKDGISSVQLIDNMGTDLTVVNAARVSMAKESDWLYGCTECGKTDCGPECPGFVCATKLNKQDCGLISYLAKHRHWTPFSHPQVTLRIKMPIFIARQWFKHMVGFTRNEVSRRYVDETPEFYNPMEWRRRAENVKQGSSDDLVISTGSETYKHSIDDALDTYQFMLSLGVCPEQARMVLPQSMYTEFIETGSLAAYARLASLRLDPHAQREVQWYAEAIDKVMGELYPISWEALRACH